MVDQGNCFIGIQIMGKLNVFEGGGGRGLL